LIQVGTQPHCRYFRLSPFHKLLVGISHVRIGIDSRDYNYPGRFPECALSDFQFDLQLMVTQARHGTPDMAGPVNCRAFRFIGFRILVIGGCDERLLRRWINLIWLDLSIVVLFALLGFAFW
jgi:hypothetical protein